ncbi:hypothetical protein I317_00808 [Kwoniella heveanensis CBS 569]|nr:hypothetical protein I317_00808 [Kwoniella heveanensis CBS 569]
MTVISGTNTTTIYPPWNIHHWRAVDDRVRGGSSVSHLEEIDLPHVVRGVDDVGIEKGKGGKAVGARFWGTLDTKTLGGAGFASQSYRYGPAPLQLPRLSYAGLTISHLADPHSQTHRSSSPEEPRKFTLVLKTTPTAHIPKEPKVPPQPRESQLTYEASFSLPHPHSKRPDGHEQVQQASFEWSEFHATYRGRPVQEGDERWVPLDPGVIYELSFMCRSDFGKQEGDFGVVIVDLKAILKKKQEQKEKENSGWISGFIWSWFGGVINWFKGLMGWKRIKLEDAEGQYDEEKRALIA